MVHFQVCTNCDLRTYAIFLEMLKPQDASLCWSSMPSYLNSKLYCIGVQVDNICLTSNTVQQVIHIYDVLEIQEDEDYSDDSDDEDSDEDSEEE